MRNPMVTGSILISGSSAAGSIAGALTAGTSPDGTAASPGASVISASVIGPAHPIGFAASAEGTAELDAAAVVWAGVSDWAIASVRPSLRTAPSATATSIPRP